METALVASVLKMLVPKIFAFLQENRELRRDLALDIQYIRDELGMIAAAIEDHDRRSWSSGTSDAEMFWIQSVRELAYSIEDSMDRFLHRVSHEPGASSLRQKGHRLMNMSIRTKFAAEIRELRKKSEAASRLREKYTHGGQSNNTSGESASTFTASDTHAPAGDLVGMDAHRDELLELIREDEDRRKQLKVISIVGCGGLGKTVLARQVYNCAAVSDQYEPLVWVRASEKGAGDVLKEILQQVPVGMQIDDGEAVPNAPKQVGMQVDKGNCDVSKLIADLKNCLHSKRFFIVIDDMRTEYWNTTKNAFPRDAGVSSRVIVTTTIHSIANACSSVDGHVYVMRPLDKEHSRQLFFKEVSLVNYGPAEQVVNKCDGLPLALVTTAQLLQSKGQLTPEGCANLCRYMGEHVEKEETLARMKHVLLQSYSSLPGHVLKACLLYFGIFPSGRPVSRKCLIRRWLAEGFVQADHRRSAPVVALDNFKELMNRSVIQSIDLGNNTEVKTCQTHSMMLEFILQKSICENVITLLHDQAHLPDKIRRLSLHRAAKRCKKKPNLVDLSLVRSLSIFGEADEHVLKFGKYKLLRVLDLEECEALNDEHLKNICNLLLLRYLSLGPNITTLPKEISKLKFLETLDVRSAKENILPIPIEVIMLPCLIHLLGVLRLQDIGYELSKLQAFLSENSNLETLAGFVADQRTFFLQLINHMNSLKKVKVWFQPNGDFNNSYAHLSRPIQEYIQRGTDLSEARSLSLSFEGCSQDFLDFPLTANSYYLSSLKLHGELCRLPPFITRLGSVTELCLLSPGQLSGDVLAPLSKACNLHYLKLMARQLGMFIVKQGALVSLRRLCIEVQSMTSLEIQEGALPQLESFSLLCKELNGLCGAKIEHLKRLKDVALDDLVVEETKKEWREAARMHPRRPRVSFLKTKNFGDDEAREIPKSPAASTSVTGTQVQLNRGSEPSAAHKIPLFGALFSRKTNVITSTELLCAGNAHEAMST
ncbi:unnamed protein product [Urochloa humidicola]